MELEPSTNTPIHADDRRPRLAAPLPVRLVAVEDVTLPAAAGLERDLDAFYVALLGFARDATDHYRISYHAENLDLHFDVLEPLILRDDVRMIGIEVPSLNDLERALLDLNHPYRWEKGLTPGVRNVVTQDPAGNWLQFQESRPI